MSRELSLSSVVGGEEGEAGRGVRGSWDQVLRSSGVKGIERRTWMVLLRGGAISSNGIEWKRSRVGRSRLLVSSLVHGSDIYGLLTGRAWLTILLRVEGRIGQCCWSF